MTAVPIESDSDSGKYILDPVQRLAHKLKKLGRKVDVPLEKGHEEISQARAQVRQLEKKATDSRTKFAVAAFDPDKLEADEDETE